MKSDRRLDPPRKGMKRSEIYLLAAQVVEARELPSCCAVDDVVAERGSDARKDYRKLFHPDGWEYGLWGNAWLPNKRQCRILALLFMAAIAEDEEAQAEVASEGKSHSVKRASARRS